MLLGIVRQQSRSCGPIASALPVRLRYTQFVRAERGPIQPDPIIEAYKKDIDRTLLRENLKLTVEDRLRELMELQKFSEELRNGRAARSPSE